MNKFLSFAIGVMTAMLISGFTINETIDMFEVNDVYKDSVLHTPYEVEVCKETVIDTTDDVEVAIGALWGAIIGAVVGDAIDEENGKLPGAIIGGAIGANEAQKTSHDSEIGLSCIKEIRYTDTVVTEYSHSTVTFSYIGKIYELQFRK